MKPSKSVGRVVRERRIERRGDGQVEVDEAAQGHRRHRRQDATPLVLGEPPGAPVHRTKRITKGAVNAVRDVVAHRQPDQEAAQGARSRKRLPSAQASARSKIRAMNARWSALTSATVADDQTGAREAGRERRPRGDHRPHAQPLLRRGECGQRHGDADGRQEVRAEGDRPDRDQLEQPGDEHVRGGSRWGWGMPRGTWTDLASPPSRRRPGRAAGCAGRRYHGHAEPRPQERRTGRGSMWAAGGPPSTPACAFSRRQGSRDRGGGRRRLRRPSPSSARSGGASPQERPRPSGPAPGAGRGTRRSGPS